MTNIQLLINELKDMEVLYKKGFMSAEEFSRIAEAITHEIGMEAVN